ncbi:Hypothetical protein LUCI_3686 [Lucifera butyrica]|uniref:SLH domain-containing protein n=1 Tax=Lucifera butyrica TaxID=1351585 RepID=A0A498RA52_9FIRM|nr:S-layer homology domain-containing protein [Lucifera butyrica]VBB08414.1 Hypothetical protein LUCI_3686 [Lucifera butyrica]
MKKALIFTLTVIFILSITGAALAAENNPFATVPTNHWAYQSIVKLVKAGLIDGYGTGDFRGDKPATRYELAELTAKAMYNWEKADAQNKGEIDKLEAEFRSELINLGVHVKALETQVKDMQNQIGNFKVTGTVRIRYDHKTDHTNAKGDYTTDSRSMARDTSYYFELTGTSKMGGNWNTLVRLAGAKDANGQPRGGQENTDGKFDITRLYAYGPLGFGTLKVGRDKGGAINGMVMNDYYTGAVYSFGNLLKVNVTYAKPDHLSTIYDDTGLSWKDDRGINDTFINPADSGTNYNGINFWQVNLKYPVSKATDLYGGFWHTCSANSSYTPTNIYELAFKNRFAKDWSFGADYARSDRDSDNTGYNLDLTYKTINKAVPGSWSASFDYVRIEAQSYIKSTFDIKNNKVGRSGWQIVYKYVPARDILWSTRWLQSKDINGSDPVHEKWLRTQVEFFF